MYCTQSIQVHEKDAFFPYCDAVTKAANNLYNSAMFRCRQVLTAAAKEELTQTKNEQEVMAEIRAALPKMKRKTGSFEMPSAGKTFLNYYFLDALFKATRNPDYYCDGFSVQTAQKVLKEVEEKFTGFYSALRSYKENPAKFTGKPGLPKYLKKGGNHTAVLTNQECRTHLLEDGTVSVQFPKTKLKVKIGKIDPSARLKQVTIKPFHNIFVVSFVFEKPDAEAPVSEDSVRACCIDFGVNNLAAITNNIGQPSLLFKGKVAKAANQWYNKQMAGIVSAQTTGTTKKFVPTAESQALAVKRDNIISDIMHKVGKQIVTWCVENRINTIIIGHSDGWKQESHLGKQNNQNFVQIPFLKLQKIIEYLAADRHIQVVIQEESYTSKASFLDGDYIPAYGKDDENAAFSGKRNNRLYRSQNGTILNADLNGSANIGRKAVPELFVNGMQPDFDNVIVIAHPDKESSAKNRQKQLANNNGPSKAKLRRDRERMKKVILMG